MLNCSRGIRSSFLEHDAMVVANSLRSLFILAVSGIAAAAQITQSQSIDLPGETPVSVPQPETSKLNVSTMGLRISSDFDDNALNSQHDHRPDSAFFIQPHLGWRVSGARLGWAVDYTPGFSRSGNFAAYDSVSHLLDGGFQLKLTKRLKSVVREAFLKSANPFDQLQAFESATGSVVRTVPTQTATITAAEVRTEQASIDVTYALSAHSTLGIGGEFFGASYSLSPGALLSHSLLENSSSMTGRGYYLRQVTRHQWTGLDYHVQKSIFNGGQAWSLVQSLAYTHTIAISPAMTFSLFLGPERSVIQSVAATSSLVFPVFLGPQSAWQWSGGVIGRWSGERTSVRASLSRRINNGGILGAARLSAGSAEIRRQLARQWTTRLLASYDQDRALVGPGTLSYSSVAGSLAHTLGPHLSIEFEYWRVHVSGNSSLPAGLLADHNRISMSLVFEQSHLLGR